MCIISNNEAGNCDPDDILVAMTKLVVSMNQASLSCIRPAVHSMDLASSVHEYPQLTQICR